MRNLLFIIQRYQKFLFYFAIQLFCIVVFVRNNNYQFQSYLHNARGISGAVYKEKKQITSYFNLQEKNKQLHRENAILKSRLGINIKSNPLKDTSFSLAVLRDDNVINLRYTYLPARVLNNSVDKKNNFITLDKGATAGVKKNMNVVGPKGIVGKIIQVTPNYSLAASVLSNEFGVSSVTPNGTLSKVAWESLRSPYHAVLTGIPESEKLKKGDSILTSGFSQFPPNILIGRVVGKLRGATSGGGRYKIQLATEFKKLDFVYIIQDKIDTERKALEDTIKQLEQGDE